MSSSSRTTATDSDPASVDLPVFLTPVDLVFASNLKRSLLTIFNPYDNDAQFRIMTTSPDRFDVSLTKGIIKSNRRIDITIRLLSQAINELPDPTENIQVIDYFRVSFQVGQMIGNKPIKIYWCLDAEKADIGDKSNIVKLRLKASKTPNSSPNTPLQSSSHPGSKSSATSRVFSNASDNMNYDSSVNLVCTLCAFICVLILFMPIAIDQDFCIKNKAFKSATSSNSFLETIVGFFSNLLSVSTEVKLGCSFALGLFTYRLINTLP